MEAKRAMVIFSGGLDSTVSLYKARKDYSDVLALTFTYGSSHQSRELRASREICEKLNIEQTIVDLPFVKDHFRSALLNSGGSDSFIVPFRNGVMLSIAAGIADSQNIGDIVLTTHYTDSNCFPDCTKFFNNSMARAIWLGTASRVNLKVPYEASRKYEIVKIGAALGVPFGLTYSCYKGGERHCGVCPTCRERKLAFELAKVDDPTIYEKEN